MSTRAGSATAAIRAKQNLVRLLFPETSTKTLTLPMEASTNATTASYNYCDLRTAYLRKVQELHPDKHYQSTIATDGGTTGIPTSTTSEAASTSSCRSPLTLQKTLFLQVQDAWKRYESFAKDSNQCLSSLSASTGQATHGKQHASSSSSSSGAAASSCGDANFTMFGVGCSFADNDQERQYRNYIMDQASRGYFTTGEISGSSDHHHLHNHIDPAPMMTMATKESGQQIHSHIHHERPDRRFSDIKATATSLCHDDLFDAMSHHIDDTTRTATTTKSPSLVSHLIPPHRRPQHHHKLMK